MRKLQDVVVGLVVLGAGLLSAGRDALGDQLCVDVPATSAAGLSFRNVVAGQTYQYSASGLVTFTQSGCQADPDGQVTAPCSPVTADDLFLCPGLQAFSLVAMIGGGTCLQ